ncbi:hypothetical protein EV682_101320 [Iodobacter fluviatilis]|uniref:Uncharacterized protein n=1 Tax=Iodobacter fluviatilis TaxID=537 RepID=A0A377Q3E1_9NEIS|nr:hypothetical protein EV682_101320 [Iodobacter fluviatilis]STQ89322.1 Uncharacterised protein [Iodobacter fluviatilis]
MRLYQLQLNIKLLEHCFCFSIVIIVLKVFELANGVQGVGGSNPLIPTNINNELQPFGCSSFFISS